MSDHVGTHGRYTHGCRCDRCKEAHRAYTAERRKVALAAGTLTHGRASTFDAGCRCDACYNARRVKYFTNAEYEPVTGRRRPNGARRALAPSG